MPSFELNNFFPWISKDDIIAAEPQIVEGNNVTWLNTGYWVTLWPKMNKQLLTNGNAPRTIFGRELSTAALTSIAVWCDTWEIYKLTSTDNTPIDTLTTGWNIVNGALLLKGSNFMYFASKQPWVWATSAALMQVTLTDFNNETFTSKNEAFLAFDSIQTPPMLVSWGNLYVWGLNTVFKISSTWTITTFAIFNRYVTWITVHGTQFLVYTDEWDVSIWDWVATSISATVIPWFRPAKVIADWSIDHIISQDWNYMKWSWYDISDPITKNSLSARLNDNSQYISKFDFTPQDLSGRTMETAEGWLFMISNDTNPWIYRQDKLIPWLQESFHKSITRDNTNVVFDEIFTLTHLSKGQSRLFIWFQSWTTKFWVDYIDLNSKETAKDGYFIIQIFRWPPNKVNQTVQERFTASLVGWSNFIKIYKRINNASTWTLLRDTTADNNQAEIFRDEIETAWNNDEYIDIQFKVELHNEAQWVFWPILHWLEEIYSIIKE